MAHSKVKMDLQSLTFNAFGVTLSAVDDASRAPLWSVLLIILIQILASTYVLTPLYGCRLASDEPETLAAFITRD